MSAPFFLSLLLVFCATLLSLLFSSLTYSLRDFSRPKLADKLQHIGMSHWFDRTIERANDLIFVTATGRLFANLFIFIGVLHTLRISVLKVTPGSDHEWMRYFLAAVLTSIITLLCSVAIPHALAEHMGETLIAHSVRFLHAVRFAFLPMTRVMHTVDRMVRNLAGHREGEPSEQLEEEIEQEILSAVEEGEKEGVVGEHEREMIESVMEFVHSTVSQVMTPRPKIMGIPVAAKLDQVKSVFEESGHSRLPVYEGTLDKIAGILYSRDLIRLLGESPDKFDLRTAMRPPFHVPETKPLRDLLDDFRAQKVHIAIVLDEYGGTAGLITIEDIFKELIGDVSDEHMPSEPTMMKRLDGTTAEADGRILIEQLNRTMNLEIPEDAGYETLGGFVSTTLGRVPEAGTCFEYHGTKFTILDAEPQKVNRVKIEQLAPRPTESTATT